MEAASKSNLKKIGLELGGKSPLVVFDDADCKSYIQIVYVYFLCDMMIYNSG